MKFIAFPHINNWSNHSKTQILSFLFRNTNKFHTFFKQFSSVSNNTTKWNSNSSFVITNPTLLIMESCNSMFELKQIQAHMTRTGLIFHLFPVSRVLSFSALSETGDIAHAHVLFLQIVNPNVYMWNTMIRGYCKARMPMKGFSFFREMVRKCVEMDSRSFVFALKACEILHDVELGKSVQCWIWKVGFVGNLVVGNGLIHFYADNGDMSYAQQLFDEIAVKDVVSWTAMIDGYVKKNMTDEALKFFDAMLLSGVEPNEITMITVFSACSQKGDLCLGKRIHGYVEKSDLNCSLNMMNAMLDMYVKCGCLMTARQIFDKMEIRDVFSWTSMINGCARNGELVLARKFFEEMPERNVVSWNAMIGGYSQNNQPNEALELFHDMVKAGLVPIESTLVCVLSACGQSGCLDLGSWIHQFYVVRKRIKLSVILGNALIDMYAKCGNIDAAAQLFSEMQDRDLVSWNSMIVGYASHGHANKALALFDQMKNMGYRPDDITFVGVLSACCHGGLIKQGRSYFEDMTSVFGLKPKAEHYTCLIDLLGRVGLLEEAYDIITKMPMEPDEAAWGALLNACRMHGNVELGKIATDKLINLNPNDSGTYMLFASLCSNEKKWNDVSTIRSMMKERGVKKTPGHSAIELDGKFHNFLAADESHPCSQDIYKVLSDINILSDMEECKQKNVIHIMYCT